MDVGHGPYYGCGPWTEFRVPFRVQRSIVTGATFKTYEPHNGRSQGSSEFMSPTSLEKSRRLVTTVRVTGRFL